jgi:hypothetical protein
MRLGDERFAFAPMARARNPYARRWLWIPGSLAKGERPGMTEVMRLNPIQNRSDGYA